MAKHIKYDKTARTFLILTKNTAYTMGLINDKYLVHYFYGAKHNKNFNLIYQYRSFSPYPEETGTSYSPDTAPSELPFFGSGDFRIDALRIRNRNGDRCTLFTYKKHKIFSGRKNIENSFGKLPFAVPDEKTETLCITMEDSVSECTLDLYYTVFFDCDVISRYYTVTYNGNDSVKIEKSMSLSLDIPEGKPLEWITLNGSYGNERYFIQRRPIGLGIQGISSNRGASSSQHNPFLAVCEKKASERKGEVYGFNFVYSGSFLDQIELDQTRTTRVQMGLGQDTFGMLLKKGESFSCPEAVMTYTNKGTGQMSRNFHDFIRKHILPENTLTEKRPVVLNTWEASFFDIDQTKLLSFADAAKNTGIDMLVMDDGWFGTRNNDSSGLGDWVENKDKFPDGLGKFIKSVKNKGVKFGIWVEPEMVNPDSELYRTHPEWCCTAKGRTANLSRNQLVLDMSNPQVLEYLKKTFSNTLKDTGIDYIKWDMNRNLSEVASNALPPERQDETWFRYMTGVYELFEWFLNTFPGLLIESCSGGGGRYDMGIMKYSGQIWTSDCTHPAGRIGIQSGTVIAYPPCVMSCHVSNAENLTSDEKFLDFAYKTALNGVLGYELHLPNMSDNIKKIISDQVKEYHTYYEEIIKNGDFYKLSDPIANLFHPYRPENYYRLCDKTGKAMIYAYYFISKDRSQLLATFLQSEADKESRTFLLKLSAANKNYNYKDRLTGIIYTGDELKKGIKIETSTEPHNAKIFDLRKI